MVKTARDPSGATSINFNPFVAYEGRRQTYRITGAAGAATAPPVLPNQEWIERVVQTPEEAARAAEEIGLPIVLKLAGDAQGTAELHEEALDKLLAAEEAFPHRADFIAQASELSFLLGDIEEALGLRLVAHERVPHTFWHMNAIGKALMRLGRPEEAIDYLRDAMAAHDRPVRTLDTYVSLARAYSQTFRFEPAWLLFTDLIQSKHYQTVQPKILLDAINVHIQLDRDLFVAAVMMTMYEELVPEGERDKAYPFLRRHLDGMRQRPKRETVAADV